MKYSVFLAPTEKMRSILERTIQEAKDKISKKLAQADQCVTCDQINEALQQLKGAVMIVYPMGLPPYDPIELEFKNQEELEGTQVKHILLLKILADFFFYILG